MSELIFPLLKILIVRIKMSEVKPSRPRDDTTVHNTTTLAARECHITGPGRYEVAQDKGIVISASNVESKFSLQ